MKTKVYHPTYGDGIAVNEKEEGGFILWFVYFKNCAFWVLKSFLDIQS